MADTELGRFYLCFRRSQLQKQVMYDNIVVPCSGRTDLSQPSSCTRYIFKITITGGMVERDRCSEEFSHIINKNNTTNDQMMETMKAVPEEYRKVIAEAISVHRDQLRQHLLDNTTAISQCFLRDFDWQLKLVMSSDKLAALNEPLLNIDLELQDGAGDSQQVAIELDKEELKKLLISLEGCSKAVQQLTV